MCLSGSHWGAGPAGRPRDPLSCRSLAREESDHPVERSLDAARKCGEHCDRRDRDDGQDDAVLGHGLTLLALAACAEAVEPFSERQQVLAPPSGVGSRERGSVYLLGKQADNPVEGTADATRE